MGHGCNNVTPQEETRDNREYKPQPKFQSTIFYSPRSTRKRGLAVVDLLLVPGDGRRYRIESWRDGLKP